MQVRNPDRAPAGPRPPSPRVRNTPPAREPAPAALALATATALLLLLASGSPNLREPMPGRANKRRRGEEEEESKVDPDARNDAFIAPRNRTTPEQREKLCGGASGAL